MKKEYFCTKCDKNHRTTSKIGKRHLKYREAVGIIPKEEVSHEVKPEPEKYTAMLNICGKEHVGEGLTVLEAIEGIDVPFIKLRSILSISYEDKKYNKAK